MDLFDAVAFHATEDRNPAPQQPVTTTKPERESPDWTDVDFGPWEPLTPEAEAALLGADKAGTPLWSDVSAKRIKKRLQAIMDRLPEEDRPPVLQAFEDGYRAARRRRVALAAMDKAETWEEIE